MVTSMLRASVLLVILCVAKGQSTTSDSHCSYTFKVPTAECSQAPVKVELLENSIVALQEQMKLLASDNKKLREELATIKAGRLNIEFIVGSVSTDLYALDCCLRCSRRFASGGVGCKGHERTRYTPHFRSTSHCDGDAKHQQDSCGEYNCLIQ